jgi:hypothetical protein
MAVMHGKGRHFSKLLSVFHSENMIAHRKSIFSADADNADSPFSGSCCRGRNGCFPIHNESPSAFYSLFYQRNSHYPNKSANFRLPAPYKKAQRGTDGSFHLPLPGSSSAIKERTGRSPGGIPALPALSHIPGTEKWSCGSRHMGRYPYCFFS